LPYAPVLDQAGLRAVADRAALGINRGAADVIEMMRDAAGESRVKVTHITRPVSHGDNYEIADVDGDYPV
jgi:hypothetical protein